MSSFVLPTATPKSSFSLNVRQKSELHLTPQTLHLFLTSFQLDHSDKTAGCPSSATQLLGQAPRP